MTTIIPPLQEQAREMEHRAKVNASSSYAQLVEQAAEAVAAGKPVRWPEKLPPVLQSQQHGPAVQVVRTLVEFAKDVEDLVARDADSADQEVIAGNDATIHTMLADIASMTAELGRQTAEYNGDLQAYLAECTKRFEAKHAEQVSALESLKVSTATNVANLTAEVEALRQDSAERRPVPHGNGYSGRHWAALERARWEAARQARQERETAANLRQYREVAATGGIVY